MSLISGRWLLTALCRWFVALNIFRRVIGICALDGLSLLRASSLRKSRGERVIPSCQTPVAMAVHRTHTFSGHRHDACSHHGAAASGCTF